MFRSEHPFIPCMSSLKVRIEQDRLERIAYVLKCMAHPLRLSIIDLLDQQERLSVTQLQEVLQIEQSLLSHHLTNMRDKSILGTQREGKNIYYFLLNQEDTMACLNNCKVL